jgi:hypothetical protein
MARQVVRPFSDYFTAMAQGGHNGRMRDWGVWDEEEVMNGELPRLPATNPPAGLWVPLARWWNPAPTTMRSLLRACALLEPIRHMSPPASQEEMCLRFSSRAIGGR